MLYIKNYIYYFVKKPQYSKIWKNNSVNWKLAMLLKQEGICDWAGRRVQFRQDAFFTRDI